MYFCSSAGAPQIFLTRDAHPDHFFSARPVSHFSSRRNDNRVTRHNSRKSNQSPSSRVAKGNQWPREEKSKQNDGCAKWQQM